MTDTTIEIQGYYGISPCSPVRTWKRWGNATDVAEARRTIEHLGLSDAPSWKDPNGWRIAEVETAEDLVTDEVPPPHETGPGREAQIDYKVQGYYRRPGGGHAWSEWLSVPDPDEARLAIARFTEIAKNSDEIPDQRLMRVTRLIRVIEQPDMTALTPHRLAPDDDLTTGSLVFHLRSQPSVRNSFWAEEGFHYVPQRPQYGPLPLDAQHRRHGGGRLRF